MLNKLTTDLSEFKRAIKVFRGHWATCEGAMLSCESGILCIECGGILSTLRVSGEWHGRAYFSGNMVKALAMVPPVTGPVEFSYRDGILKIATVSIGCQWENVSHDFVERVANPTLIDLLAMDRTMPRSTIHGTGLAPRIRAAKDKIARVIVKAAKLLDELEISQADLLQLLENRVQERLSTGDEK